MRFFRVGKKIISRERLFKMVSDIMSERERGATQEEAARSHGVQRSFISFLESLGEIRRGSRVVVAGFPVANWEDVCQVADSHGVESLALLSREDCVRMEAAPVVVLAAGEDRVAVIEKILGREVVGVRLIGSGSTCDGEVDLDELEQILAGVTIHVKRSRPHRRAKHARSRGRSPAAKKGKGEGTRWKRSKRS